MMRTTVKKMYKEAINCQEYNKELLDADIENTKPTFFSGEIEKTVYTTAYYGWLIAKGRYLRQNYE